MLVELIIFAVVLVVLETAMILLVSYLAMKKLMSKKFIEDYTKMAMEVTKEVTDDLFREQD